MIPVFFIIGETARKNRFGPRLGEDRVEKRPIIGFLSAPFAPHRSDCLLKRNDVFSVFL